MTRRRALLAVAAVVAAAFSVWWWHFGAAGARVPVTEAEARHYLNRIVAAAGQRDFDRMCRLNGAVLNCRRQLNMAGEDAVPPAPPDVVASRYHEKDRPDGTPGRILVVAGTDGRGRPYRTEVMVFRENRYHFKAINAVYWSNFRIIEGNTVTPDTPGPAG